jgi:hypothetical protein
MRDPSAVGICVSGAATTLVSSIGQCMQMTLVVCCPGRKGCNNNETLQLPRLRPCFQLCPLQHLVSALKQKQS